MSTRPDNDPDAFFEQVGPAMTRMRRRIGTGRTDPAQHVLLNLMVEAEEPWTVGGIAAELGISQPVASRNVAAAIKAGRVRRVASQTDGRSAWLELTDEGRAEQARLARRQAEAFISITRDWTDADRRRFTEYLVRYSQDAATWSSRRRTEAGSDAGSDEG